MQGQASINPSSFQEPAMVRLQIQLLVAFDSPSCEIDLDLV